MNKLLLTKVEVLNKGVRKEPFIRGVGGKAGGISSQQCDIDLIFYPLPVTISYFLAISSIISLIMGPKFYSLSH